MNKMKLWMFPVLVMMSFACSNRDDTQQKTIDFSQTKNLCLGRIDLTVPKETHILFGQFLFDGHDFIIEDTIKSLDEYNQFINKTLMSIKDKKNTDHVFKMHKIVQVQQLESEPKRHILVSQINSDADSNFEILAYLFSNQRMIQLKSKADASHLNVAILKTENALKNFKPLSLRQSNEAGICWKDYFISDAMTEYRFFLSEITLQFPSYPEISFNIENRSRFESDQPLIETTRQNKARLPLNTLIFSEKTLRENVKIVNHLKGEEVMTHYHPRLTFLRGFETGEWQYLGTLNDPKDHYIDLSFSSIDIYKNKNFNAYVSQEKGIQLYDFILNSIQVSQNNQTK